MHGLVALLTLAAPVGLGLDRVDTSIEAHVSDDLSRIELSVRSRYTPAVALAVVTVVLAADRYARPPPLRASSVREIYPADFDAGGFSQVVLQMDGAECSPDVRMLPAGERLLSCPRRVRAGETVLVEARAVLRVPVRYGPFGRVRRHVTLAGGWYPYPAREDAPPPRGPHTLRVEAPSDLAIVTAARAHATGRGARRTIEDRLENAAQAALLLRPASLRALPAEGAIYYFSELERGRQAERTIEAIASGIAFLEAAGVDPSPRLIAAEAPLRHDLAHSADGLLLVSDRAFRILPIERAFRFHRVPILRELFGVILSRRHDALMADALASWLVDRKMAEQEDAFDVLGFWSFLPAVDSMLYAPELPFAGTYFRVVDEEDPLRDDFLGFPLRGPRGRLIYLKLADRLGAARSARELQDVLSGRGALSPEAQDVLRTWSGGHPDLQYRLGPVTFQAGAGAKVTIERTGASVVEPVQVALTARDTTVVVTSSATGAPIRTVTAALTEAPSVIELDPEGRLSETPSEDRPSPRFDNRSPPAWKFLLNNFNLLLSATAGTIDTAVDIGFSRVYDVHWRFAARADYGPDAISLSARATYGFGAPVTAASLAHFAGVELAGEHLRGGFADEAASGQAAVLRFYYGYDDRESIWAPSSGTGLRASVGYSHVFGPEPDLATGGTRDALSLNLRAVRQWKIGLAHQLSLRASFGAYAVGSPRKQLLFGLGGRYAVRGYAADDALGRMRAIAGAEWLHPLLPEIDVNGAFLVWLTGLDGAVFGDVAVIGDGFGDLHRPVADVGYGLRFYMDWGGVRPGVMAIDLAFPLVSARGGESIGPPALYLDFAQSFTTL